MRGKDIPKPVKNWNQCGLSSRVLDVLKKAGLAAPMPIQVRVPPSPSALLDPIHSFKLIYCTCKYDIQVKV